MAEWKMDDFLSAVGSAVLQAQQRVEQEAVIHFLSHFRSVEPPTPPESAGGGMPPNAAPQGGALTPEIQVIRLPFAGANGTPQELNVPIMTLLHHDTLSLDQVKVRVHVRTRTEMDGTIRVEPVSGRAGENPLSGEDGEAPEGGPPSEQTIELTFKRSPPAEGIARVTQGMTQLI